MADYERLTVRTPAIEITVMVLTAGSTNGR
jgi:hypothetical protein